MFYEIIIISIAVNSCLENVERLLIKMYKIYTYISILLFCIFCKNVYFKLNIHEVKSHGTYPLP